MHTAIILQEIRQYFGIVANELHLVKTDIKAKTPEKENCSILLELCLLFNLHTANFAWH